MGICASGQDGGTYDDNRISRMIDNHNAEHQQTETLVKKLLLLGAGESGKSTLFKQIFQLYGEGYSEGDRAGYRMPIYNNIINSMKTLLSCSTLVDEYWLDELSGQMANHRDFLLNLEYDQDFDERTGAAISALWKTECIQRTFELRSQFQIPDNIEYFFDGIETMCHPQYTPSYEDMIRSRVRTTGIVESNLSIEQNRFRIIDVGGQRNERMKWIHCFEEVTGVIFVAAISEYDQRLYEDETTNRMTEAVELFDEICNSRWFKQTSMILFLNKKDLFELKIKSIPLTVWAPEYDGPPGDVNAAFEFLRQQFEKRNQSETKEVYTHICCALDTGLVSHLFTAVKDIIIRRSLRELQLD